MAKSSQGRASRSARSSGNGAADGMLNGSTPARPAIVWAPPMSAGTTRAPEASAVSAFELAMAALQRHDYRAACDGFQQLIERFPSERALLDRARVYATLCERELRRATSVRPRTLEERLTAATAALNNDQNDLAGQLLAQIVDEAPHHELGHYLMAVLHARRGDFGDAIASLRQASTISPEVLAQARHDEDFQNLRGLDAFEELLTGLPPGTAGLDRPAASGR